jgi:hypothetical protein
LNDNALSWTLSDTAAEATEQSQAAIVQTVVSSGETVE